MEGVTTLEDELAAGVEAEVDLDGVVARVVGGLLLVTSVVADVVLGCVETDLLLGDPPPVDGLSVSPRSLYVRPNGVAASQTPGSLLALLELVAPIP